MEGKGSVLVVDDELGSRESMRMILKDQYNVSTADGGAKAIEILKANDFDVVVLDIRMPDMSGIQFVKSLVELKCNIPFIVSTGQENETLVDEMMNLGAREYVVKDYDFLDSILHSVQSVIG